MEAAVFPGEECYFQQMVITGHQDPQGKTGADTFCARLSFSSSNRFLFGSPAQQSSLFPSATLEDADRKCENGRSMLWPSRVRLAQVELAIVHHRSHGVQIFADGA